MDVGHSQQRSYPVFFITTIPCNPPFPEWKFASQIILEILRLLIGFLGYWYLRRSLRRSKNNLDIIINPWSIWAFSLLSIGSIPYPGKMLYHVFGISLSPVFSEFFMLNSLSYSLFNNGWFLACSIFFNCYFISNRFNPNVKQVWSALVCHYRHCSFILPESVIWMVFMVFFNWIYDMALSIFMKIEFLYDALIFRQIHPNSS